MAKKVFLNRERAIPTADFPSVSWEETASTSRNSPVSEQLPFLILDDTSKFNATGRSVLIKFKTPVEEQNPTM